MSLDLYNAIMKSMRVPPPNGFLLSTSLYKLLLPSPTSSFSQPNTIPNSGNQKKKKLSETRKKIKSESFLFSLSFFPFSFEVKLSSYGGFRR